MNIKSFLDNLIENKTVPGACAAVITHDDVLASYTGGCRSLIPQAKPMETDTLFDMASLTKILSPTMIALRMHHLKALTFEEKISDFFSESGPYADMNIKNLLTHSAGFMAEAPLWKICKDNSEIVKTIFSFAPAYAPGKDVVYSCLGFIILGKILEKAGSASLEELAKKLLWERIGMKDTTYFPDKESSFASTELKENSSFECWTGTVHDENARFILPGCSGNAGVFSSLNDMITFCRMILMEIKEPCLFTKEETMFLNEDLTPWAATSRGLGFMVNVRGFSDIAGKNASYSSFGHTGFTGTSIWLDPEKDRAAILLSNRVHPSRGNTWLLNERKNFHDIAFSMEDEE